jgi:uncharacterized surface protein with fasciclin (FAS1) repeats
LDYSSGFYWIEGEINMSKSTLIVLLTMAIFMGGVCAAQNNQAESGASVAAGAEEADIVDTLTATGDFNTLLTAIHDAGLVDTLKGPGPFTVFAPTDEAFAGIPQANLDALLNNTTDLTDLLTYHVVRGEIMSEDLMGENSLETMNGQNVTITTNGNVLMVEGARVVQADIEATNGVIHVVDAVLMPTQVTET